MKTIIGRNVIRIGMIMLTLIALVSSMALPAAAATTPGPVHTVQGTVTSLGTDGASFYVQSGTQTPVLVRVDANTKYLIVPLGRVTNYVNNQVGADRKEDKNNQPPKAAMKNLHIPANWRNNLGWLETFQSQGKQSDVQVGDRVIAQLTADGIARQVLIVKAPVIQQIRGTITAISASSITITAANGTTVTLASNANTRVTVKGFIQGQINQNALAVYNRNTMVAQTITIQSPATVNPPNATLSSIAIAPAVPANLTVGAIQQFSALATYSNGTQSNVTAQVTWTSSVPTVATVSSAGLATGLNVGVTTITATLSGITSNAAALNVVAASTATLTSVTVTGPSAAIFVGQTQQYNAIAAYSNGVTQNVNSVVSWVSSNTTAATIATSGVVTGAAAGTTTITANLAGITSPGVALTINAPTLSTITVTPGSPVSLHVGAAQQFIATAAYNNGNNVTVTSQVVWASSNTTAASITSAGLLTALAAGTTNLTAAMSGVTSADVNVTVVP